MTAGGGSDIRELDALRTRFEHWRETRGRECPIPPELWAAAMGLARREGIYRTAAALRLNGSALKRHMMASTPAGQETSPPAFVELRAAGSSQGPEYTLELEGRHGKLHIHAKGASAAEIAALSRALWEVVH